LYSVDVESEPGQGARFRLIWPAAGTKAALEEKEEVPAEVADSAEGRTILLAEDEKAVRRLVRRSVETCGYRVIETSDGEEALAALRERGDEIAVVLVDLSMSRRNGADTIAAMREIRPGLSAVLMTGKPDRPQTPELLDDVPVVIKPFSIEELEGALRDSLAEAE
jgi:two-component system cell cycle sensor histidine kinase/response regulator CckA